MVQITPALLGPWFSYCVGRTDDYALQQEDGSYLRTGQPLTYEVAAKHLQGVLTVGTYVINEYGQCWYAVYDSDTPDGLMQLHTLQSVLAGAGVVSYLEMSRRGAHLWVFFAEPLPPVQARQWLLPYCPAGVEFYPKQDYLTPDRPYGSVIRLPLGVHRLTGNRHPFVQMINGQPVLIGASLVDLLLLFPTFQRVQVPLLAPAAIPMMDTVPLDQPPIPFQPAQAITSDVPQNIREWCLAQDPIAVIGRYVSLDGKGIGCCPFGWHHDDGVDSHPSFYVYRPTYPHVCCWYCHTWKAGGSLFDFLRYYYGLEAGDLWSRLCRGAQF